MAQGRVEEGGMSEPAFSAPLSEWALHYAKKGIPVFPLAYRTKVPAIPKSEGGNGCKDATTDLDQVRKWWAKYPNANIGAATGFVFDVLDVDMGGMDEFRKHDDTKNITCAAKTLKGGYHVYYTPTIMEMANAAKRLPGLDVRTKGGYVVMPPSFVIEDKNGQLHEGHYEWVPNKALNGKPLPEVPKWVWSAFKRNPEGEKLEVSETLQEGGRNDALFRLGCALRSKSLNDMEILVALKAINEARCSPPLTPKEVEQIAKSINTYPPGPSKDYPKPAEWIPNATREQIYEKRESQFIKLSSVEGKPVDWLFTRRFARGMLSAVAGDPGEGKSTIARAMATMITTGQAPAFWGMQLDGPRDVIWLTKEESLMYSVVPTLKAMGADLDRVHALSIDLDEDGRMPPDFVFNDWGIQQLRELVEATEAAMIVMDPLVAFFDAKTDIHRQNETRHTLARLIIMAEQTGCVPVGIVHQSKAKNSNALLNILGSVDFGAAIRTGFLVGHDPDDRDKKAFVQTKSNLGPFADPIGFSIGDDGEVLWDEHCTLDAERLNEPPSVKAKKEKIDACEDWLKSELDFGQHAVFALLERAKEQGFSKNTLYRAADELRVSRGNEPTPGRGRGPAWWAKSGYDWYTHQWGDPFEVA
jgi:hypothetical protein